MLYIDEVNLLDDMIVDAILDAAAQGRVTVRRGPLIATYPAELILVGSMNPEEGKLRPQIHDRFGLRVVVNGLYDPGERIEIYRRVRAFRENPHRLLAMFMEDTVAFGQEITRARELLPKVDLLPEAEHLVLRLVQELGIPSHRAEITALEAARAYAAADGRQVATTDDVMAVVPMALRQRRSDFIRNYCEMAQEEEQEIRTVWRNLVGAGR